MVTSERLALYFRVFCVFARNSLVREMSFRANFLITLVSEFGWLAAQLLLFKVIYLQTKDINGWSEHEYFAFLATSWIINGIVETFFMLNCTNFSELIRTGNLDFALLKPIDTQFLVSLEKIEWSVLCNIVFAVAMLAYALAQLGRPIDPLNVLLYIIYIGVGVAIFYSVMLALTSASVWMGRNQSLHEFWYYVTVFARYPREIYRGSLGRPIYLILSYGLPILLVVNVPAQTLVKVFDPQLALVALFGAAGCLFVSRHIFRLALVSYRSASS